MSEKCKICGGGVSIFSKARILSKYDINYYKCEKCGFIFTEDPFWLEEAYDFSLNITDTGIVRRNIDLSKLARLVLIVLFNSKSRFLDYGGGSGLFVRLMRDYGFNFFWSDRYSKNILSRGFECRKEYAPYELATAFEVFEHMENPIKEISGILEYSGNILFSTMLVPQPVPKPGEWWYYGMEHGQHISFYSYETLKLIANSFNLKLYSNNRNIHLLASKKIPFESLFKIVSSRFVYKTIGTFIRKTTLIHKDHCLLHNEDKQ